MRATVTALLIGLSALALTGCGEKKAQKTPMELKLSVRSCLGRFSGMAGVSSLAG